MKVKRKTAIASIIIIALGIVGVGVYWEDIRWTYAKHEDTLVKYQTYVSQYPTGKYTKIAKERIDFLSFQQAESQNSIESYYKYLKKFPDGIYRKTAKYRFDNISYKSAKAKNTPDAYEKYLDNFPKGEHRKEAQASLDNVSYKLAKAKNTPDAYEKYLDNFPKGEHRKEAQASLDNVSYKLAKAKNTPDAYEIYLTRFPNGLHRQKAKMSFDVVSYKLAKSSNTANAYNQYLDSFPDGLYREPAKRRLDFIAYGSAMRENTQDAYEKYLSKYPNGQFIARVKAAYDKSKFYNALRRNDKIGFEEYLRESPKGKYRKIAIGALNSPFYKLSSPLYWELNSPSYVWYRKRRFKSDVGKNLIWRMDDGSLMLFGSHFAQDNRWLLLQLITYINGIDSVGSDLSLDLGVSSEFSRRGKPPCEYGNIKCLTCQKTPGTSPNSSLCHYYQYQISSRDLYSVHPVESGKTYNSSVDFRRNTPAEKHAALRAIAYLSYKLANPNSWLVRLIEERMNMIIENPAENQWIRRQALKVIVCLSYNNQANMMLISDAKKVIGQWEKSEKDMWKYAYQETKRKKKDTALKKAMAIGVGLLLLKKYLDYIAESNVNIASSSQSLEPTRYNRCEELYEALLDQCKGMPEIMGGIPLILPTEKTDSPHYKCVKKAKEAREKCWMRY